MINPLLSMILVPAAMAVAILLLGNRRRDEVRWLALVTTILTLSLMVRVARDYSPRSPLETDTITPRLHWEQEWLPFSGPPQNHPLRKRVESVVREVAARQSGRIPERISLKDDLDATLGLDRLGRSLFYRSLVSELPEVLPLELTQAERLRNLGEIVDHLCTPRGLRFELGIDGISLWLVFLTALLMIPAVLISWEAITDRPAEFYALLLFLESGMIGVFCAFDLILFYVFFEFTLLPLFFLIGIWGGPQRRYAAGKFFIYTLTGSLITLLGLLALVLALESQGGPLTFSIPELARGIGRQMQLAETAAAQGNMTPKIFWYNTQFWVFLAMALGFSIKVPLVPFHTWLPLAHVEAPTAGSVLLAGVLLKLGSYGFLRLCLPLLPYATWNIGLPLIASLSVIGIVYGALCALAQTDIKRLVAYSSVSHLGFCMLGMFALNVEGVSGSVLQMVNHGLSTGALFLIVGMLYERYHTRQMSDLGGLAKRLPLLTFFMIFICLSSMGLPGLNGFVGEVLALAGMFRVDRFYCAVGATGVVLGAWYLLALVQKVFFGPLREPRHDGPPVSDMNQRELTAIAPLALLCLAIGVCPQPFLKSMEGDIQAVVALYEDAGQKLVPPQQ